ncbi:hypothetical protein LZ32DRAFT_27562 [Colletotrichum eremochloae]|nr:hypothetical protein LZ32DRAFT_27562 [Colletotrichum eremochloae]
MNISIQARRTNEPRKWYGKREKRKFSKKRPKRQTPRVGSMGLTSIAIGEICPYPRYQTNPRYSPLVIHGSLVPVSTIKLLSELLATSRTPKSLPYSTRPSDPSFLIDICNYGHRMWDRWWDRERDLWHSPIAALSTGRQSNLARPEDAQLRKCLLCSSNCTVCQSAVRPTAASHNETGT